MDERISKICVRARKNVFSHLGGVHLSKQKSQGLDFVGLRDYAVGDDVRHISWISYAKTMRLITKEFIELRHLNVYVMSLLSANMIFGQKTQKQETLADILAHIMLSVLDKKDNLNVGIFTQKLHKQTKITTHARLEEQVLSVLGFDVLGQKIDYDALNAYFAKIQKRSLIILLGDFLDEDFDVSSLALLTKKHELIMIAVRDFLEEDLGAIELASFIDPITKQTILGNIDDKTRLAYKQALLEKDAKTLSFVHKNMVRFAKIYTHQNVYKRLRQIFD